MTQPRERLDERTTLTGIPQPAIVRQMPKQRTCANCGCQDVVEASESGAPQHFVTVEVRWLKAKNAEEARESITPYQKSKGWEYVSFQGRHARQRWVCRDCLRDLTTMENDWRKKSEKETKPPNLYEVLCG